MINKFTIQDKEFEVDTELQKEVTIKSFPEDYNITFSKFDDNFTDKNVVLVDKNVRSLYNIQHSKLIEIEAIEENKGDKKGYPEILRDYLESLADSLSSIAKSIITTGIDPLTNTIIDLTENQKGIIKKLIGVADNFESMKLADIKQTVEYLQNFIANGITDGVEGFVEKQTGAEAAKDLEKQGIKARPLRLYFSKWFATTMANQIWNLHKLIETQFVGQSKDRAISSVSGIYGVEKGVNTANTISNEAIDEYVAKFGKEKDFFTLENNYERGIAALLFRDNGDEGYFEDQKSLIQQSIDVLLKSSDKNKVKKGETAQKVFDKLIKDAKKPFKIATDEYIYENDLFDFENNCGNTCNIEF
jgi:hypothetical protein